MNSAADMKTPPNYQLSLITYTLQPLLNEVYLGNCHIGILAYSPAQKKTVQEYTRKYKLFFRDIVSLPCNISLRNGHPALQGDFLLEKLRDYPFVDYIERHYANYPEIKNLNIINPSKIILINERESRRNVVARTNAYSIGMPLSKEARDSLNLFTFPFPALTMNIAFVRREKNLDPLIEEYLQLLHQEIEAL